MSTHEIIRPIEDARAALDLVRQRSHELVAYVKALREKRGEVDGQIDEAISLLSAMGYDEHGQPVKK